MSGTVLEHALVREYLHALDAACAGLPAAQARELHEQLASHLDEALPPGATEAAIRAELACLGLPRSLAAEAASAGQHPALRKLSNRLRRVRWWVWGSTGLLALVIGTGLGFPISMYTAASLSTSSAR